MTYQTISNDYTVTPHGSATLVLSYHQGALDGNLFGPMIEPSRVGKFELIHSTLNRLIVEALERAGSLDELITRLDWILFNHLTVKCPSALQVANELVIKKAGALTCKDPHYSVARASHETGYYDGSHFVRDFQSVCGLAPQEYRNRMSDFYSEIAKF